MLNTRGLALATAIALVGTQSPLALPPGWSVVRPIPQNTAAWTCLNRRLAPWFVQRAPSGGILFEPRAAAETATLVLGDGSLVSRDRGEFGGEVVWYPSSGPSVRLLEGHPVHLERRQDTVLVFEGLAHLSLNEGRLIALTRVAGRWEVDTLLRLGSAPAAVSVASPSTYLVATAGSLLLVQPPSRVTVLQGDEAWGGLYPTSLVRDSAGVIYVGASSVVFRLRPQRGAYAKDWLAPDTASCVTKIAG